MKWIYYIVVFLCLSFLFGSFFWLNSAIAKEIERSSPVYHKHKIHKNLKSTNYQEVNQLLQDKAREVKENFLEKIEEVVEQPDFSYTLYLNNDVFLEKEYCSVALKYEEYLGGAHPMHYLWTMVYDTLNKKVINLEDLIQSQEDFLKRVSSSVRSILWMDPRIVDTTWMMEGTRPLPENYQNFVLTEQGIVFYFLPYQIAPYSSGTFEVLVNFADT